MQAVSRHDFRIGLSSAFAAIEIFMVQRQLTLAKHGIESISVVLGLYLATSNQLTNVEREKHWRV